MSFVFLGFFILSTTFVLLQIAYALYTIKDRGRRIALVYERERLMRHE